MKTDKVPENVEVTPPAKKLKQARLPFKIISDVSPKPAENPPRKRKLSVPDAEPATKVGKISKENDLASDLVVISDDESKDGQPPQKEAKLANPYVKLVDNVRKKKLQKAKASKKKSRASKKDLNGAVENPQETKSVDENSDVEMIECEVVISTDPENDEDEKKVTCDTKNSESRSEITNSTNSHTTEVENSDKEIKTTQTDIKHTTDVELVNSTPETDKSLRPSEKADSNEPQIMEVSSDDESNTENGEESAEKSTDKEKDAKDTPVTPKRLRSSMAKTSSTEKTDPNSSTVSSKLDESVSSGATTPKQKPKNPGQGDENKSTPNLTPKQLQKKLEFAKKREEREKEKLERELKRQQEKEERAKQRQEKEDAKKREREEKEEAKRKEREEKEEQKRKEREEKEKQREQEKKMREWREEQKRKEKEDKEEQRRKEKEAREEEFRKRQEAKELEKQEQKLKKKKAAEAFVNFFVPKQKVEKAHSVQPVSKNTMLSSFTIKSDMRLAPTTRGDLSEDRREALDRGLKDQDVSESGLYLKSLKGGEVKPSTSGKTWPLSDKDDDDVMIVEDELPPLDGAGETVTCEAAVRERLRPKLLSFHENRRPPYWGTWRKKSANITPRRPFGQDQKQLDYEVDSDDEWEEDPEGESLDGSACGSDDEDGKGDEYEVDNEVFVPHGYLSDEDGRGDEYEVDNEVFVPHGYLSDEEATMDEDDVLSLSPETQKARLKHLEDEFESEMKKPTEKLKPRLYGLLWENKETEKPENCVDALWNYFGKFAMVMNDPTPLMQPSNEPDESEKKKIKKKKVVTEGDEQSPKAEKKKKSKTENKDNKKPKPEVKKIVPNQPGINTFLKKLQST